MCLHYQPRARRSMANSRKSQQLMYLPKNQWSPRYDSTFYSLKLEGSPQYLTTSAPSSSASSASSTVQMIMGGKTNLPAYFFQVVVYREHTTTTLLRRYSQFRWLYDKLIQREQSQPAGGTTAEQPQPPLHIPPKTCPFPLPWQKNDEVGLAKERMEGLEEFLNDALCRPGFANDPAVLTFLEIENWDHFLMLLHNPGQQQTTLEDNNNNPRKRSIKQLERQLTTLCIAAANDVKIR
jgi:PX domain